MISLTRQNAAFVVGKVASTSLVLILLLNSCAPSVPLTSEESAYLALVESIDLPLKLPISTSLSDTIRVRATWWIEKYADYSIVERSNWEIATSLPTDPLQGGHGYTISWGVPKESMVVTIKAYSADPRGTGSSVSEPHLARMLGLYIRDGILPPTDNVGISTGRR